MKLHLLRGRTHLIDRPLLVAALAWASCVSAHSAEITATWIGGANGNWTDGSNWSSRPAFPNNGADTFDVVWSQHGVTITLDQPVGIRDFTLGVVNGTLAGESDLNIQGTLKLTQGTIATTGSMVVTGPALWTAGGFDGAGQTTFNGGLTITNAGNKTLQRRVVNSSGLVEWRGGQILSGRGMVFNNAGVFETSFDGTWSLYFGGQGAIKNTGTFRKTAGGSTGTVLQPAFNNDGLVQVNSGELKLQGGGVSTGAFTLNAGASLVLGGGQATNQLSSTATVSGQGHVEWAGRGLVAAKIDVQGQTELSGGLTTFTGPVNSLGSLLLSGGTAEFNTGASVPVEGLTLSGGTLAGQDRIVVSGPTVWKAGGFDETGTAVLGGAMIITNSGNKSLQRRTVSSNGDVQWVGGQILSGQGMVFNNAGIFETGFDGTWSLYFGGSGTINNSGVFRKTAGASGSSLVQPTFNNNGLVEVKAGELKLQGGGVSTGSFVVHSGASLLLGFGQATNQLTSAAAVSGQGHVEFGGRGAMAGKLDVQGQTEVSANTTFNGPVISVGSLLLSGGTATFTSGGKVPVETLTLAGGALAGTDDVSVSGPTVWTAGGFDGIGSAVLNGPVMITNVSGNRVLQRCTVTTKGEVQWRGGQILSGRGMVFNNEGLFDTSFDGNWTLYFGGEGRINNSGTFRKSGGTNDSAISPAFENSGTVEVNAGELSFLDTYTQTAGRTLLSGGNLSVRRLLTLAAGELSGAGKVTTAVVTNYDRIALAGSLTFSGDYHQAPAGALGIRISGTNATSVDKLQVSGTAHLDGTLNVSVQDGFEPQVGDTFSILGAAARSGQFRCLNGAQLLGKQKRLELVYGANNVALVAVSAPGDSPKLNFRRNGAALEVCWDTVVTDAKLETTTNLAEGPWTVVEGLVLSPNRLALPVSTNEPQRFFRLVRP